MKLKILNERDNYLELEIEDNAGDPHTIPSLISFYLNQDKTVEFAAYKPPHPLRGNPIIIIRAKNPKNAFKKAIKKAIKELEEIERELFD